MTPFHARILASDTSFFDGSCEFMTVPCTDGAMGILAHHSNMIAAVVPGELRFQPADEPLRTAARRQIWRELSADCGSRSAGMVLTETAS